MSTCQRKTPKDDEPRIPTTPGEAVETQLGDSPVVVRQKLYEATPMSVDQALYEMELRGIRSTCSSMKKPSSRVLFTTVTGGPTA